MGLGSALEKNIGFWHWYPELLVRDLTPEQLRWQPEGHDSSILFALWHAYRACDDIVHGMVFQSPSVYASQGWAERLPVSEKGLTPFGNGFSREQIARLDLDAGELCAYARAVGEGIVASAASLTDDELNADVFLPFFTQVYPGYDRFTKLESIAFFAVGHTSEHLGEVQFIRGLLGLRGAPL